MLRLMPSCARAAGVLALLGLLAPCASRAQAHPTGSDLDSLPLAPGRRVITLTPRSGYYTEPAIAVDPRDPAHVLAAYQDNAHAAWSIDSGKTWTIAAGTEPPNYRVSGDVSVTFDRHGHAFLCYIAFDRLGTAEYWAHDATRNGIFVRRSLDAGGTWEPVHVPVIEHPTVPGIPFEDKPYIVADNTDGPYAGNLYIGWTRFTLERSEMLFSRSTDDGKSWSPPIVISTEPGLPRDDNGAVEGFSGAVAPDGTLYVIWSDGSGVVFTSSRDGGRSFAPSRRVIPTAPSYFNIVNFTRGNGFPQIAMDPRTRRLFVTWSGYTNGDYDIFEATSADGGSTWSSPVRVNTDALHSGRDQFFQWLAVDPTDGSAYVLFYDRRADPSNARTRVTLARSTDGGRSFTNYAWTRTAFDPRPSRFLGDYSGIAALGGRVYGIWTEAAAPDGDVRGTNSVIRIGVADFGAHQP